MAAQNRSEPLGRVSPQELKVLGLIAAGGSNKDIAVELAISVATVKSHITHLFEKLNAENRTHAVAQARRLGLIA